MRNFSGIKHRIKSVSDTQKITGAMETISVAKMRKALHRYENNKTYFETIRRTINEIVLCTKQAEHKVFLPSAEQRAAFVVVASDKGFAGGFNHNILAMALRQIERFPTPHIFAVGQVAAEFFSAKKMILDETFADASFDPAISQAAEMSERLYAMFEKDEIDCAYIVYTAFDAHSKMQPEVLRLLPFDRSDVMRELTYEESDAVRELTFEPSAEAVLEVLIPQYLTGLIYGALVQSSACEHSQRRSAMRSATQNASDILEALHIEYNRARQESVTGELIEIVTTAGGVKEDDR